MSTSEVMSPAKSSRLSGRERIIDLIARYGIFLVLLAMVIVISILTPIIRGEQYFLTGPNLIQVALQASINAIIAVGMTFIIVSGGIDLSVGSIVALCGVVAALVMRDGITIEIPLLTTNPEAPFVLLSMPPFGPLGGFLTAVIVGLLCGLFNGVLITIIKLPPFIATLGTMGIFRGIALIISEGRPIYGFGREFLQTFSGSVPIPLLGDIPVAVLVSFTVAGVGWFIYTRLKFGKYTIAIGGNEETTRLSGIPVGRYKLGVYCLGGLLTGIAAALLLARLSSGDPTFGQLYELDAIAAAVMGGTSLTGGEGSIAGTMVGALIISLVRNAMNLFNIPSYYQQVVIGTVIVLAVMLDRWRKRQTRQV